MKLNWHFQRNGGGGGGGGGIIGQIPSVGGGYGYFLEPHNESWMSYFMEEKKQILEMGL